MKKFALIGAAGYIAPRHMSAIRETKNELVAALDPSDSVGVLDSYFPDAYFFTEFERFDRHLHKRTRREYGEHVNFVSICSPNYLHDSHIRFALRTGADAICEKPLVLNPWNIDALADIESETGRKIYSILQLRLHPSIIALKQKVEKNQSGRKHEVDLTYITSRGRWYLQSWKGLDSKSGGIATNIGVHFFDMLGYIFGSLQNNEVHLREETRSAGFLEYRQARVRWFLSISENDLPGDIKASNLRTFRSITVDNDEIEFSGGFTDLHTASYQAILSGQGYGLEENRVAIETVADIRTREIVKATSRFHPLLSKS